MRRKLVWMAAMLSLALVASAPGARATPLSTVVGGGPVVVGDLVFSDFEAVVMGDLISNLSFYDVSFGADGFALIGPFSAADGEVGLMSLSYVVQTADPTKVIVGASLFASHVAEGVGAQSATDEVLRDLASAALLATLSTFDTGATSGDPVVSDSAVLAGVPGLRVVKSIFLDSALVGGALGGSARIGMIEQRFAVTLPQVSVPEASTGTLLALGLAGLALAGSRRPDPALSRRRP